MVYSLLPPILLLPWIRFGPYERFEWEHALQFDFDYCPGDGEWPDKHWRRMWASRSCALPIGGISSIRHTCWTTILHEVNDFGGSTFLCYQLLGAFRFTSGSSLHFRLFFRFSKGADFGKDDGW